jgi:hypothetical protein
MLSLRVYGFTTQKKLHKDAMTNPTNSTYSGSLTHFEFFMDKKWSKSTRSQSRGKLCLRFLKNFKNIEYFFI